MVRHAQSRNNAVSAGHAEAAAGGGRVPDPELTEAGRKQAESLGKAAADGRALGTVREVWVSPMKRALQTAAPLAKETGAKVVVRGDCFEQGGVHEHGGRAPMGSAEPRAMGLDEAGIKEVLTAAGVDAANIEVHANVFQGADKTQGWYRAAYESMDDALGRAKRFADALWKEAELHHDDAAYCDAQAGGPCLVVVAHGLVRTAPEATRVCDTWRMLTRATKMHTRTHAHSSLTCLRASFSGSRTSRRQCPARAGSSFRRQTPADRRSTCP